VTIDHDVDANLAKFPYRQWTQGMVLGASSFSNATCECAGFVGLPMHVETSYCISVCIWFGFLQISIVLELRFVGLDVCFKRSFEIAQLATCPFWPISLYCSLFAVIVIVVTKNLIFLRVSKRNKM
jgi:hypothetical protein